MKTGREVKVWISLDSHSNRTYILEETAKKLELQPTRFDDLCVSVFGANKTYQVKSQAVTLGLKTRNGTIFSVEADLTKVVIGLSIMPPGWPNSDRDVLNTWQDYLADDPFDSDSTVQVLIGADYIWDILNGARVTVDNSRLFMLGGQVGFQETPEKRDISLLIMTESHCGYPSEIGIVRTASTHQLNRPDVDEFWTLESIGISDCPVEDDDERAQEAFDESVTFREGRYHVKWPWIAERRQLPSNYDVALNRFISLTKRLVRQPEFLKGYSKTMKSQLRAGII